MRTIYIILILVAFFLFCQCNDAIAAKGMRFSISFDKSEYTQKDPIKINFKLENKGKADIYVNKRLYINSEDSSKGQREVYLLVTSPSGEKLPCKISHETGLPKTDYFVLLKPGEEVKLERERNIKYYFDFNTTGKYKIIAVYQNIYGEEIGIDAFKDEIKSKRVTIEIIK